MPAYPEDIFIEQGASFLWGFVLYEPVLDDDGNVLDANGDPVSESGLLPALGDPLDLSDVNHARMQIRPKAKSPDVWVHATSLSLADDADGGQRIFLQTDDVLGRVDILLTDLDTDHVIKAVGHYDLELVWNQQTDEIRPFVQRVLQGGVTCDLNTTRGEVTLAGVDDGNSAGDGA